jgi:hypothetical protein
MQVEIFIKKKPPKLILQGLDDYDTFNADSSPEMFPDFLLIGSCPTECAAFSHSPISKRHYYVLSHQNPPPLASLSWGRRSFIQPYVMLSL